MSNLGYWRCPKCNFDVFKSKQHCRCGVSQHSVENGVEKKPKVETKPHIKYLRLILDRRIFLEGQQAEGHVTFLYFGKYKVDTELLEKVLKGIKPFNLSDPSPEKMGKNFDIDAIKYKLCTEEKYTEINTIRGCLMRICGPEVEEQNFPDYNPHVTGLTMEGISKQNLGSLLVCGIESNDGQWKIMF